MTPMVDLAFLLLTFFILTTVFYKPYVMQIRMPPNDTNVQQPINHKRVVTLILGGNDQIYWYKGLETTVEQTDFSSAGIRRVLLQLNSSIKDMVVLIKPSAKSRYQNLIDVLDEMTISSISRYYLVDITTDDINLVKTNHKTL
jgi:biopolymer transport protein ExbD